jgi:hypothetical protein
MTAESFGKRDGKENLKDRQNMRKDLGYIKEKICIISSGRAVRS